MLPEIVHRLKQMFAEFNAPPITLDLKQNFGFDLLNIADLETQKQNRIRMALGGYGSSWAGETITNASSMNHSVVWACRRIIAESVAFMPLTLMQRKNGEKQPAINHPAFALVHDEPNPDMTDMEFREALTDHVVSGGNAYAQIIRRSGNGSAIELQPIQPANVEISRDSQKRLVYTIKEEGAKDKTYTVRDDRPQDILHIRGLGSDGTRGYSVLAMARQSMGTALAAEKYAAKFYAAGGRVPYVIEMAQKFKTVQDYERWRHEWNQFYGASDNFHQAVVMEPGMTYKQIGLSPEDSQFLETRQFEIPEICRWFLMQPHMVGDLSRATFNNIEHLALQFVKMTLTAWIVRWEKALRRCLLTPEEKTQGYFFHHNVNGLLRGDFQTRMAGYASALQNGHLSINEVRDLEDRNPVDGGDDHHIQLNMQSLPGETPTASQSAALLKVEGIKGVSTNGHRTTSHL